MEKLPVNNSMKETEKNWDNCTLNYDLDQFNWPRWALEVIQEIAPKVKELETMHEVLEPHEVVKIQQHVQNSCLR